MLTRVVFPILATLLSHSTLLGQTGGFVVTLGSDTTQVERFTRNGSSITGTVVTRVPQSRIASYTLVLDEKGAPSRYQMSVRLPDGTELKGDGQAGSMIFAGDTIIRETLSGGAATTTRIAKTGRVFPNLAGSYLLYELGIADLKRAAPANGEATFGSLTMFPSQQRQGAVRVWLVGQDSAEVDYFGVARSGYRLDAAGRLLRVDMTATTQKYKIVRVTDVDVDVIAKRWAAADARGEGLRALSPRDTMRATVGRASIAIEYSRPSKRGREIWGNVVPWNAVWRLGADVATHFETSADLNVGGTVVPAGRYTLWMFPTATGASQLIVNSRINIFGTGYNGTGDFARIPLRSATESAPTEQLTIEVVDNRLMIRWDTRMWSVPIATR